MNTHMNITAKANAKYTDSIFNNRTTRVTFPRSPRLHMIDLEFLNQSTFTDSQKAELSKK